MWSDILFKMLTLNCGINTAADVILDLDLLSHQYDLCNLVSFNYSGYSPQYVCFCVTGYLLKALEKNKEELLAEPHRWQCSIISVASSLINHPKLVSFLYLYYQQSLKTILTGWFSDWPFKFAQYLILTSGWMTHREKTDRRDFYYVILRQRFRLLSGTSFLAPEKE